MACFDGGSFILGGLTLNDQAYIDFGLKLVEGCHATYSSTATGIGPEGFQWQDSKTSKSASNNPGPPSDQASFYNANGFWITAGNYVLRPEVIESYYYAYRATGDTKYQDWAWNAFVAITNTTRVGSGYSSINNVNQRGGGGYANFQESFWFAEVLKYSYLIQAPVGCSCFFARIRVADAHRRTHRGRFSRTTRTSLCSTPRRILSEFLVEARSSKDV